MKLTVLMENTGPEGLRAEHGLSLDIRYRDRHYLLDTGASEAFAENARALGVDLSEVDAAFLSHGHYDHSGGFEAFFRANARAAVYVRQGAQEAYYSGTGERRHYIGVPRGLFEAHPDRFRFVEGNVQVETGVWLIPDRVEHLEEAGRRAGMSRRTPAGYVPDDFRHEQSLVLEGERGLVVCNSCCHGGSAAIVAGVLSAFSGQRVYALAGGFHLMGPQGPDTLGKPEEEVRREAEQLKKLGVERVLTGHCTGTPGFRLLRECLGDRAVYLRTGDSVEL